MGASKISPIEQPAKYTMRRNCIRLDALLCSGLGEGLTRRSPDTSS